MRTQASLAVGLIATAFVGLVLLFLHGCCHDAPPPASVIDIVTLPCAMPSGPGPFEEVVRVEDGCPEDRICFDRENGARLAYRLAKLQQWIAEVKVRCVKHDASIGPDTSLEATKKDAVP